MQICLMLTGKREIRVDLKNREGQRLEDDQCHKQSKYRYNVRFVSFRFNFQRYSFVAISFNAFASEAINEERPCYFIDRQQFVRFHARL